MPCYMSSDRSISVYKIDVFKILSLGKFHVSRVWPGLQCTIQAETTLIIGFFPSCAALSMQSRKFRDPPKVTGLSPKEGPPGTKLTIRGENLGINEKDVFSE